MFINTLLVLSVASIVVADTLTPESLAAQFSLTTRQMLKLFQLTPIFNPVLSILVLLYPSRPQQQAAVTPRPYWPLTGLSARAAYRHA
jgi:hypothetical protein